MYYIYTVTTIAERMLCVCVCARECVAKYRILPKNCQANQLTAHDSLCI